MKTETLSVSFMLLFALANIIGWIMNIVDLFGFSLSDGMTLELGLRLFGIFVVPLGAIMGYFA